MEVAATLLLPGAQVIAEYERIEIGVAPPEPEIMHLSRLIQPRCGLLCDN